MAFAWIGHALSTLGVCYSVTLCRDSRPILKEATAYGAKLQQSRKDRETSCTKTTISGQIKLEPTGFEAGCSLRMICALGTL